jgi:hypothetical protein
MFILGSSTATEITSNPEITSEIARESDLTTSKEETSVNEQNKLAFAVTEANLEQNTKSPAEAGLDQPELNFVDSDLFEKALPDKSEDSQSIIQVSDILSFKLKNIHIKNDFISSN